MQKYIFPRLKDIIFLSVFSAIFLLGPYTFNLDGDLGRHITIGNYILKTLSIPTKNIFSHTLFGQPLTPHEWLAQTIFALAHQRFLLSGVVFVTALVIAGSFTLVYHDSQIRSKSSLIALAIVVWSAAASSLHWLARPHIFTFLFLAIWIHLLERVRQKKRTPLWVFGLIMLIWANTHGAFITGFVTWGAYLAGGLFEKWTNRETAQSSLRSWVYIGLQSFAVTFINPVGYHLWTTSVGFVSNQYLVSHTQEYLPPNFHNPGTWPFLMLIAFSVFVLGVKKRQLSLTHGLLLTGWTALGLYSARNISLYGIIAAPILSEVAAEISSAPRWKSIEANIEKIEISLRGGLWPAIVVVSTPFLLRTPVLQAYNLFDPKVFPVKAVDWLSENPQEGHVFNYFSWGGYLLYRQWPGQLVFIDGQTDFYGEELTREYEQVIAGLVDWEDILIKYQVEWAIIPKDSQIVNNLLRENWFSLYEDSSTIIIAK